MKRILYTTAALLCASPGAGLAQASEPSLAFSGFATLGAVSTSTDLGRFNTPGQTGGAGKSPDFDVDSKVGVQFNGRLNATFSGTVQLLSKLGGEGNYQPRAEWLFAKAQVTPGVALRLGRMGVPAFAVSDFRDVNYSNLWVRPPLDVYGQVPVSHFDGADLIVQHNAGTVNLTVQAFAGKSTAVYDRTDLRLDSLRGINATAEFDNGVTLRIGHFSTRLTVDSASLAGLVAILRGTPFASVGNELDATRKAASFSGVGLSVDRGNWVGSAEYTRRKTASYVPDTTGWYGTLGYRVGKFTPFLTLSSVKTDDVNVVNTIPVGLDPGLDGLAAAVNGVVSGQYLEQKTTGLGVRWDGWRNTAVKFQWDRVKPANGNGLFNRTQPGFGGAVDVLSLSLDAVF